MIILRIKCSSTNPVFTMEQLAVITLDEAVMILTFTKCPLVFITLATFIVLIGAGNGMTV